MKFRVLLVEDNDIILKGLVYTLESQGFEVITAKNYHEAMSRIYGVDGSSLFDIAVLDITLPDGDGFDLCSEVKDDLGTPVIFLTAKDSEQDVVHGFDLGADDYIVKPFRNRELISRINAVLRRSGIKKEMMTVGKVSINPEADKVFVDGREVEFTALEYRILLLLFKNAGKIVTREMILSRIWDMAGNYVNDNTLTVYIKRIRNKLGDQDVIKTVKGTGYKV